MAFIAFEGLDHSGKSTLIQALSRELKENYHIDVVSTREPGGTQLGEVIRKIVLNPYGQGVSSKTEVLLICASRKDHIEKVIQPAMGAGRWVLCDRYWASTVAFQGKGRKLPEREIRWLNQFTVEDTQPDLWILLDLPITEKEKRAHTRGIFSDRFEMQNREFHQRVRECYIEMARGKNWLVLDALLPKKNLVELMIQKLKDNQWLKS